MSIAIGTERLSMRQLSSNDWSLFLDLQTDSDVIALCFDKPSEAEVRDRFESRLPKWEANSEHWLCLTIIENKTGQKVGVTGFNISDGVAEVGYLILPTFHGNGFGTESLEALLDWSKEFSEISSYQATVTRGNIASERVLEKCGFSLSRIAKDAYEIRGELYDDHIYSLDRTVVVNE